MNHSILTIFFALFAIFGAIEPVKADAGGVIGGMLGAGLSNIYSMKIIN